MTDYDRGAYTPQPDAPLQFDARGPRGRKPMPMTLIGSGAVLIVLLGAFALHYRHDTKTTADVSRPVSEPQAQLKSATPVAAQRRDVAGSVDVFGGVKGPARAPTFAAAPETPKPRAQLTIQAAEPLTVKSAPITTTNATTPAPVSVAKAPPAATPVVHPASTYIAPTAVAIAKPAQATAKPSATDVIAKVAATPVAKPTSAVAATKAPGTTTAVAKAATTPAAKPTAGGAALVQIGAFSSTSQSDKGWADVSAAMAAEMGGKSKRVETLDKDGKTLYRTSVAGFSSRSAADAFCKALAAKGHTCFAKG